MKTLRNSLGFTLIEIVTVVVVLGILSAFSFSFIERAVGIYTISSRQQTLYQQTSYIMERISRELGDMITPAAWTEGVTSDFLQLNKAHSTPMDPNTAVTFQRDTDKNELYRITGGIQQLIGTNVVKFEVTKANTGSCNKSVSVTITLADGDLSYSLTSTVIPKNLGTNSYTDTCFNGDYRDVIQ